MREELLEILKKEYKEIKNKSEKQKVSMLIFKHMYEIREDETNKVFVYCGADTKTGFYQHIVDKNDPDAENILYWDIEQPYMINVYKKECEEFENNNKIVYGDHTDIMLNFFNEAIKTNQDAAVKKIVKKYGK